MPEPSSRYQLVQVPQRAPGTCLLTGTPEGPFLDTGRDFGLGDRPRYAGRVYLSVVAVRELAEQGGIFEELRQKAAAEVERAYRAGYAEGVKESVGDVTDLVERLHDAADRLGGLPGSTRAGADASEDHGTAA